MLLFCSDTLLIITLEPKLLSLTEKKGRRRWNKQKEKFQMPSAYTVLFIIIAVIAVLTWFIPAGHYSVDDAGNIVAGSYERVQQNPQGLWDIFMAPINGMLGVPAGS